MTLRDIPLDILDLKTQSEDKSTSTPKRPMFWEVESEDHIDDVIEIGKMRIEASWLDQIFQIFLIKFELKEVGPTITEMENTIREITATALHEFVPSITPDEARHHILFQEEAQFFYLYFAPAIWKKAYMTLAGRGFISDFVFPLQEKISHEFGSILKVHHRSILDLDFFLMLCTPFIIAFHAVFLFLSHQQRPFKLFCFGISIMGGSAWWARTNFPFKDTSSTWRMVPVSTAAGLTWNNFWPFAAAIISGSMICSGTIVAEYIQNKSTFNMVWLIIAGPHFFALFSTAFVLSIKSIWFCVHHHLIYCCTWFTLITASVIIYLEQVKRKNYLEHDYLFIIGQCVFSIGLLLNFVSLILSKQYSNGSVKFQLHWSGVFMQWIYFLILPILIFYQERYKVLDV